MPQIPKADTFKINSTQQAQLPRQVKIALAVLLGHLQITRLQQKVAQRVTRGQADVLAPYTSKKDHLIEQGLEKEILIFLMNDKAEVYEQPIDQFPKDRGEPDVFIWPLD